MSTIEKAEKTEKSRRADELEKAVRGKRGARLGDLPLQELLLIAGGILMPLGIIAIVIGWYGTARTPFLFEQIPFMTSGGFAGLALVLIGGFLYFGAWIARMVNEARDQSDALLEAIQRLEDRFAEGQWTAAGNLQAAAPATAATAAHTDTAALAATAAASRNGHLVATQKGTMVHLPDCGVVANRDGLRDLSPDEAQAEGLVPCKLCAPFG